jgi:hypothetical protein
VGTACKTSGWHFCHFQLWKFSKWLAVLGRTRGLVLRSAL